MAHLLVLGAVSVFSLGVGSHKAISIALEQKQRRLGHGGLVLRSSSDGQQDDAAAEEGQRLCIGPPQGDGGGNTMLLQGSQQEPPHSSAVARPTTPGELKSGDLVRAVEQLLLWTPGSLRNCDRDRGLLLAPGVPVQLTRPVGRPAAWKRLRGHPQQQQKLDEVLFR